MKKLMNKLVNAKISNSYMFILFGISAVMMAGYFSYAWFTIQGVQQYSIVTGTLSGTVAIGDNSVSIEGVGVINYTPKSDVDIITLTVTNTSDRTVKNSIYYYDPADENIKLGYTSDSSTIPTTTGVSIEKGKSLTYKIGILNSKDKEIRIGSSMGLASANLTVPSNATVPGKTDTPTIVEYLLSKVNDENLEYNSATDAQKNQMWTFSHEQTEQTTALTDYRYIGSNPNNYVKFNDELWRIIGVFDVDNGTGTVEKRLKIIRNETIGNYSWDNKDTTTGAVNDNGKNNWPDARLNYLLNSDHDNETYGGSLYWNRKSGTCYSGANNATVSCDFTSSGLTDNAKKMIDDAMWYLGGNSETNDSSPVSWYSYERGTKVYGDYSKNWVGKVGLIYPSDYGYATSGGDSMNRTTCLTNDLVHWAEDDKTDCKNNDWLLTKQYFWTISSNYGYNLVYYVGVTGFLNHLSANRSNHRVYPVVYLNSNVKIMSGTGTADLPYVLEN